MGVINKYNIYLLLQQMEKQSYYSRKNEGLKYYIDDIFEVIGYIKYKVVCYIIIVFRDENFVCCSMGFFRDRSDFLFSKG